MTTTHILCKDYEEAEMQSRINNSQIFITTFPDGTKTFSVKPKSEYK